MFPLNLTEGFSNHMVWMLRYAGVFYFSCQAGKPTAKRQDIVIVYMPHSQPQKTVLFKEMVIMPAGQEENVCLWLFRLKISGKGLLPNRCTL